MPCCGSTDPGTLPSASRKSRISAVRIEVSWRQPHLAQGNIPNGPAGAGLRPRGTGPGAWRPGSLVASSGCPVAGGTWTSVTGPASVIASLAGASLASGGVSSLPAHRNDAWGALCGVRPGGCGVTLRVVDKCASYSCRQRLADQAAQARVEHLADNAGGDPAAAPDDQRGRDARGRDGVAEVQRDLVAGVVQAGVADAETALERLGGGRAVPDVHAEEPDTVGGEVPRQLGQGRRLGTARGAPGSPEVHHHDVATVLGQGELIAGQQGPGDPRRGRAGAGAEHRGARAAGDEA